MSNALVFLFLHKVPGKIASSPFDLWIKTGQTAKISVIYIVESDHEMERIS
jgi:hypothetical protein